MLEQINKREIDIAIAAIRMYAESHPRPASVTQDNAAQMLYVSRATISRMIKSGELRRNKAGRIPISEIDRVLAAA